MKKLDKYQQELLRSRANSLASLKLLTETQLMGEKGPDALAQKLRILWNQPTKKTCTVLLNTRNVHNTLWDIRLSLGGFACLIGSIKGVTEDVREKALRFADMTRLHFWKYRVRGSSELPTDEDFNFSKQQAELDLKNETELLSLIVTQEKYLSTLGVLAEKKETRARPIDQLNSRVGSLQLTLVEQAKKLDAQDKKLDELARRLSGLESTLHQLHDVTAVIMDQQKREVDAIDGIKQFNGQLVSTLSDLTGKFQQLAYAMHELPHRLNGADEEIVSPRDNPNLVSSGGTPVLPSAT